MSLTDHVASIRLLLAVTPLCPREIVSSRSDRPALTAAQRADIEFLGVDRSHLIHYPLPVLSVEAEKAEARLHQIREETTLAERMDAWRTIEQHAKKKR